MCDDFASELLNTYRGEVLRSSNLEAQNHRLGKAFRAIERQIMELGKTSGTLSGEAERVLKACHDIVLKAELSAR